MANYLDRFYKKFDDIDFKTLPEEKLIETITDDFYMDLWRIGNIVCIRKAGRFIENCGIKGVYKLNIDTMDMIKTEFKFLHHLASSIQC